MLYISQHPLLHHHLSHLRKNSSGLESFRKHLEDLSFLLAYETTSKLPTESKKIQTPLCKTEAPFLSEKTPALISILRAGNSLLPGFLRVLSDAPIGYLGLCREKNAEKIIEYYTKLPDLAERRALILDPMLATGKSASKAISLVKEAKPLAIHFSCVLASPEGLKFLQTKHPDVDIFVGCLDEKLDDKAYIVPGLGDAGDRYMGT